MNSKSTFQPRFGCDVSVTALGRQTETPPMPGTLVRTDGNVLTVTVPDPLLPGTAVRIDVDGGLVLGEVVGAETGATRCYLSVMIDQVIPSLSDLASLVQRIMDASPSGVDRRESAPARVQVRRAAAR